jgi:hypothetical protein
VLIEMNREHLATSTAQFDDLMTGMRALCANYTDEQLATVVEFVTAAARVQQSATAKLTAD